MSDVKHYSVWRIPSSYWTGKDHQTLGSQPMNRPHKLSLSDARVWLASSAFDGVQRSEYEVRQIADDGKTSIPIQEVKVSEPKFNVWKIGWGRWTDASPPGTCSGQNTSNPKRLSKEEATAWATSMGQCYEAKEIDEANPAKFKEVKMTEFKVYSIWLKSAGRWTNEAAPGKPHQASSNPFRLTLEEAKQWKAHDFATMPDFEIREVLPNGDSKMMETKVFSVWSITDRRWTHNSLYGKGSQQSKDPFRLSLDEAKKWCADCGGPTLYEVREVLLNGESRAISDEPIKAEAKSELPPLAASSSFSMFDLGDQVSINVSAGSYYPTASDYTLPATIIGRTKSHVILGWKEGEHRLSQARPRSDRRSKETQYATNEADYAYTYTVRSTDQCSVAKTEMRAHSLRVGDTARLYLDDHYRVVRFATNKTIMGTVVAENKNRRVIGWAPSEGAPLNAIGCTSTDCSIIENFDCYTHFIELSGDDRCMGMDDPRHELAEKSKLVASLSNERNQLIEQVKRLELIIAEKDKLKSKDRFSHGDQVQYKGKIGRYLYVQSNGYIVMEDHTAVTFHKSSFSLFSDSFQAEMTKIAAEFGLKIAPDTRNLIDFNNSYGTYKRTDVQLATEETKAPEASIKKLRHGFNHGDFVLYDGAAGRIVANFEDPDRWCVLAVDAMVFDPCTGYPQGVSGKRERIEEAAREFGITIDEQTRNLSVIMGSDNFSWKKHTDKLVFVHAADSLPEAAKVADFEQADSTVEVAKELVAEAVAEEPKAEVKSGLATAAMMVAGCALGGMVAAMGKSSTTSVRVDDSLVSDVIETVEEVVKEATS